MDSSDQTQVYVDAKTDNKEKERARIMNNIQEKVLSDIKIILNKNWKNTQKLKEICKIKEVI